LFIFEEIFFVFHLFVENQRRFFPRLRGGEFLHQVQKSVYFFLF